MSDDHEPLRLRDARSGADPQLRRLLDTAQHAGHDRARLSALERAILSRVESTKLAPDAPNPAGVRESWPVRLWTEKATLAKLLVVVGLAATALTGAIKLTHSEPAQHSLGNSAASAGGREVAPAASSLAPAQHTQAALTTSDGPTARTGLAPTAQPARAQAPVAAEPELLTASPTTPTTQPQPASKHAGSARTQAAAKREANSTRSGPGNSPPVRSSGAEQVGPDGAINSAARSDGSSVPQQTSIPPELQLLALAQRALRDDPEQALELATQHARAYPTGAFVEEREAIAIEALIASGRASAGRARGQTFLSRYKSSAYAPRVAHLIQAAP